MAGREPYLHNDPRNFLIAHRGDQSHATENTLAAFWDALHAGARFAECDIQFTRDLQPVVLHDNRLKRLCGNPHARAVDLALEELHAACPLVQIPTLEELLSWMDEFAGSMHLFLEIKPTIRKKLDEEKIMSCLHPLLTPQRLDRITLISKSGSIVDAAREVFATPVGWVAEGHHPPKGPFDYIFLEKSQANRIPEWKQRQTKVVLYTINDGWEALQWHKRGGDFIETNFFNDLCRELEHGKI